MPARLSACPQLPLLRSLIYSSLICAAPAFAQDRAAEVLRPATPVTINAQTQRTDIIVVKFVEGHAVRLNDQGQVTASNLDLQTIHKLLEGRRIERMFTRSVADLDEEKRDLEARSDMQLADLNNYYFVETHDKQDAETLLDKLLEESSIETAYPEFSAGGIVPLSLPTKMLPDIPPTTPDFEGRQTFFGPAPRGFGHSLTRGIDGAQGMPSQIVAQLEGAWVLGHEDAENLITANVIGTTNFGSYGRSRTWSQHGTACFGLINANRNGYGVRGFAPLSSGKVSSLSNGSSNMISLVTAKAKAGAVFTTSIAYVISGKHAPLDWPQSNFDAIKRASAKGICYCFGAGNTGQDLASSIYRGRYLPSAPESGGFIIGATAAGGNARISWSNYGAKVIANGWGTGVTTIGYGRLFSVGTDRKQNYTQSFGGTSAAGPEVAGVVASLQGAHMRQNDRPLTPAQVRSALKTYGTTISGNIGKRPNLVQMMEKTGGSDGMLITVEPKLASSMTFQLGKSLHTLYVMMLAGARGRSNVGLNRPLLLDASSVQIALVGAKSAGALQNVPVPIPNDISLRYKSVFFQTADIDVARQKIHLTNSVEAWIR